MEIKIRNNGTYKGRKEQWTEEKTGERILQNETSFIHKSHTKITAFQSGVVSCAYNEEMSEQQRCSPTYEEAKRFPVIDDQTHLVRSDIPAEWVYEITIPAGTHIEDYGVNEIRFVMNESCKARLIGVMGTMRIKDNSYTSRVYGGRTINVFTEKY